MRFRTTLLLSIFFLALFAYYFNGYFLNETCNKVLHKESSQFGSDVLDSMVVVNSSEYDSITFHNVLEKIRGDFPIIILTVGRVFEGAFPMDSYLEESVVECENVVQGFHPFPFNSFLSILGVDTSAFPSYTYINYFDAYREIPVVEGDVTDFSFYQKIVIVGDMNASPQIGVDSYYILTSEEKSEVIYKPTLVLVMFYSLIKGDLLLDVPDGVYFMYGALVILVFFLVIRTIIWRYRLIKSIILGKALQVFLAALTLIYVYVSYSNYPLYVHNFTLLQHVLWIGCELIFWITYINYRLSHRSGNIEA